MHGRTESLIIMKSIRNLGSGMAFVLACLFFLSTKTTAGEFTVMPGHSIGKVWIGASYQQIRKIMGNPYLIQRDGQLTIEFWRVRTSPGDYLGVVYRRGRVLQIETNSALYKTPHQVSVESNLGYIRKVFGKMRLISYGSENKNPEIAEHAMHYYDSPARGIAFELGMGFRPNIAADVVPGTLFVHRRGVRLLQVNGKEIWSQ